MKAQEIREQFLDFFAKKKHRIIKSSPLLPKDDPTILFTNAGMNQFKNVFLGLEKRPYKRAASIQKCMRVSGKHNDLEQVGKTTKHHTFFEMLGNFSFGDYFKEGAIQYAWELVTQIFKLDEVRIYVTIYEEDEEAFSIWNKRIGIPADKIFSFGKDDNFWAMGETGPCGPCSEIHYDVEGEIGSEDAYRLIKEGSDRFIELWNLVFMEFYQDEKGILHPLPSPSIDTGMGLERLAAALQRKKSNFETDLFLPLIEEICNLSAREYPANDEGDISMRIIADHIRAISFLIVDGITPSNEGRGYVLRRLIRRAYRNGNLLGIDEPFLFKLTGTVAETMKEAYPELLSAANYISEICLAEERRFSHTLTAGLRTFYQFVKEAKDKGKNILSGEKVFKLYDTFGFPPDLSLELAEEYKVQIDEVGFHEELEKQRQRARQSWIGELRSEEKKAYQALCDFSIEFVGYENDSVEEARIIAILKDKKICQELKEGEYGEVILDKTPFYAEAGGQIGDSGFLKNPHFSALVETAYFPIPQVISHKIKVISGRLMKGEKVEASVDVPRRKALRKNHTATHLLHASLRHILGDHVKQAGSLVSPSRLRFDFTHFSPLTELEIKQVESLINEKIRENLEVKTKITTLDEGIKEGAIAIFEEKYGERVRMVIINNFSKELCGGIHVNFTGEIGILKIVSETSVAAGMRRIEALTGEEALKYIEEEESLLREIQILLNSPRKELLKQIRKLKESLKEAEKENKSLRRKLISLKIQRQEPLEKIKGIPLFIKRVDDLNLDELRELADSLKQKLGQGLVVLGTNYEKRAFIVISISKELAQIIRADYLIKLISPLIGGGGGGRADFAQAGGTKPEMLDQALSQSREEIEKILREKKANSSD